LYVPAACAAPGVTVPPTQTKSAPAPLKAVAVVAADGVNAVQPTVVFVALVQPVKLPIGRVLTPPSDRVAGSAN
jgi:hypothetical protein